MTLPLSPLSILVLLLPFAALAEEPSESIDSMALFKRLKTLPWTEVFADHGTKDWREKWTLDGKKADLQNDQHGMRFTAGPIPQEQASHAVLWTKESFAGDVKIEYEYTRLDNATKYVNILYVQATGCGEGPYSKDISEWSALREIPWMKTYFNHMDTYHISYAAFGNDDSPNKKDYIRARRYLPLAKKGLDGTALEPDYFDTGFFAQGIPHKITVIKRGKALMMHIEAEGKDMLCHWKTDTFPPIHEGRIGLRHMWTRSARYENFRVSTLPNRKNQPKD